MHRGRAAWSILLAVLMVTATFAGVAGVGGAAGTAAHATAADEPTTDRPEDRSADEPTDGTNTTGPTTRSTTVATADPDPGGATKAGVRDDPNTGPFPYPPDGVDPSAYEDYLSLATRAVDGFPNDYDGDNWRLTSNQSGNPEVDNDPTELNGVRGMAVDRAWTYSTGRPDVTVAVLDDGILWSASDLRKKVRLNTGELPKPEGSDVYDANGDGMVNVLDYANDSRVSKTDGVPQADDVLDPSDLIYAFEDGVDDDGNGYTDDIAGWNFLDDNNHPFDEVEYGHGTGRGENAAAQANNGGGTPGTCPNCMVMPLRVGQSFIAHDVDYGRAVRYAVDNNASVIVEALGTVDGTATSDRAHRYAWDHGVPIMLSSADEAAQHHNQPAANRYGIVFNAIREGDVASAAPRSYLYTGAVTNYGTYLDGSVSSTSSSEAVGLAGGIFGLAQSHAKNEVARGDLEPNPAADEWGNGNVLSAAEMKGLLQNTADDVALGPRPVASPVPTVRYPSTPGWDPYTGNGRVNATTMLAAIEAGAIPPEVTMREPRRWAPLTPERNVTVTVDLDAYRAPEGATYELQVGCTNQPATWTTVEAGAIPDGGLQESWDLSVAQVRGICPSLGTSEADLGADAHHLIGPDENRHTAMVRIVGTDGEGRSAYAQRAVVLHDDPSLEAGWPTQAGGSAESTADVVDIDGDGVDEILVSTSSGVIHAYEGDGSEVEGWPVYTDPLPAAERHGLNDGSDGGEDGPPPFPGLPPEARNGNGAGNGNGTGNGNGPPEDTPPGRPAPGDGDGDGDAGPGDIIRDGGSQGALAVADLTGDGEQEVVLTTTQGRVYAWHANGTRLDAFPVSIDYSFSRPEIRDEHNTLVPGIQAAPVLTDLDGDGDREIVVAAMDRHLYVWHHDGTQADGFPLLLADRSAVEVDSDDTVTPRNGTDAYRGAQIISTPAVCDLNGDGANELVLGTNEHYAESPRVSAASNPSPQLTSVLLGPANGRLYAVQANGTYLDGWPIAVPNLAPEVLPYVGEGIPGSPACGDLEGDGRDEAVIHAAVGPVMAYEADGSGHLGSGPQGDPVGFSMSAVGANSRARDVPYIPGLGSPTLGAVEGNGTSAGRPAVFAPAAGLGRLLDVVLVGRQVNAQDYVAGWDANSGQPLAGSPQPIEDLQFLSTQALYDVSGDGRPDLVAVSSGGSVHAWDPITGERVPGFPKTTGHWMIGTPTPGDVDGDGQREVVVTTREGYVWVWETDASAGADRQWWSDHHDAANTGHWERPADAPPAVGPGSGPSAASSERTSGQLWWVRANAETLARLVGGLR